MSTYSGVNVCLAWCLNSVLNVKVLVGAFNQEKALVGAFSVIVKTVVEPLYTALIVSLQQYRHRHINGQLHHRLLVLC